MVGYILGLGDRHLNNIMIMRNSGKVVHIDFGDCFEVANQRQNFPEKVPFRLTKILINALETQSYEGNFKITCQIMLKLLRKNKQTIIAILEALIEDPMINWGFQMNEQDLTDVNLRKSLSNQWLINSNRKINLKGLQALNRVEQKLNGIEFDNQYLTVEQQVDRLIN